MSTLAAPEDWPQRVIRDGSPPNAAILPRVHSTLEMSVDGCRYEGWILIRTQVSGPAVRDSDAAGPGHLKAKDVQAVALTVILTSKEQKRVN